MLLLRNFAVFPPFFQTPLFFNVPLYPPPWFPIGPMHAFPNVPSYTFAVLSISMFPRFPQVGSFPNGCFTVYLCSLCSCLPVLAFTPNGISSCCRFPQCPIYPFVWFDSPSFLFSCCAVCHRPLISRVRVSQFPILPFSIFPIFPRAPFTFPGCPGLPCPRFPNVHVFRFPISRVHVMCCF